MTALIIVSCFLSLMLVQYVGFKVGKAWATKHGTKEITAAPQVSGFKCPYCRVDVVGVRELDLINHSLCITRSEEDLDRVRAEAKANAKKEKPEDVYFVDARMFKYLTYSSIPAAWKSVAVSTSGWYKVYEGKIYRNGELFKSVYGSDTESTKDFAQREITIDKHRRGVKA